MVSWWCGSKWKLARGWRVAAMVGLLAGCSVTPPQDPAGDGGGAAPRSTGAGRGEMPRPGSPPPPADSDPQARPATDGPGPATRPEAGPERSPTSAGTPDGESARPRGVGRWQPVDWPDLPGWDQDAVMHAWPALLAGCTRPAPGWGPTCASAAALRGPDETRVREWMQAQLRPWRVSAADGNAEGLITGYYEPLVPASRVRSRSHAVPLHAPPADLGSRRPWYSRAEIAALPAAQAALRGREIAWVADPLDALVLQIQGSGRIALMDEREPDGRPRTVRLAFAGHNEQPYRSVGRWLVDRGALTLEQASWPAIKAWARANPQRLREMLDVNPRYVFFREEPLPDPAIGPRGAQGVPLTPGRSIAVDPRSVPYGTPVWISTTEPQPWNSAPAPTRPLQRLVMAQDTGGAILGAVRADYFWGWGEGAEERAGRMKQPLQMWALWPRGQLPP